MMFEVRRTRALDKTNLLLLAFLHATLWLWKKAITKKRMAILMKETKIKTSSLSLTLEPGNKVLVRSIFFFVIRENKNSKQDGRDLITTSALMTAVTNTRSFRCRETKHAHKWLSLKKMPIYPWLFFGWRLQEFQTVRLGCISCNFQLLNTWHENFDF